jgi:signal transduction histidine kinase
MLHEFLSAHRDELIARTRAKVARRGVPAADRAELEHGVPLFLTQLTQILSEVLTAKSSASSAIMAADATQHGGEMLRKGFTVAQVVHDYGDVCQAITELARDSNTRIDVAEFQTLNLCLDNAIAGAVTEFLRQREQSLSEHETERLGSLAHEQRNLISAAMLAFQMLRDGTVPIGGSTAAVLGRALMGLRDLTDRSLAEVRLATGLHTRTRVPLAEFIEDLEASAAMEAKARGIRLTVVPAQYGVAMNGDRQLLASAVGNLLSNAFKFTRSRSHVSLRTAIESGQVRIEVEDECGGLPSGKAEELFRPFDRRGSDRSGLGLGLAISQQGVAASGGRIEVQDLPGKGCVFSIVVPLATA